MIKDQKDVIIEQLKQDVSQLSKDLFLLNEELKMVKQQRDELLKMQTEKELE